ncbi:ABC transporter permease subunit [Microbacterium esteraromaticum]|uniref:ABC transporter permease subunit n=1 Tax=Microbacterium esteraromaticum TaxID=57043 RepID=A0A939IUL8_9MICO|nr:ABC transporter permease subunit [Microbacterium esteraromaticum]MBN8204773.1 ABC transporter permease subunit [Microbacterium esteraromaticum]MBN8414927.1 ABC transporter permease subunit [Microbacterium esteraromaticum]
MNLFADAFAWLFSPERLQGPYALQTLLGQHLFYTVVSVAVAAAIALPIGWLIGHTGKGREVAVAISGAARAVPSFGLLVLLVLVLGVVRTPLAAVITFVLLAIPSLLAGAYTGLEAIDRREIDAARAMGMTEWQIFTKVELPLGLPLLVGGLRAAVLQVIATVTIAAYVNLGGLGWPIIQGIPLRRFDQVLGGAILVAALALIADLLLAVAQRAAVPHGVRVQQSGAPASRRAGRVVSAPA